MKTERLKEKWFKFQRFYCKEGHIDKYTGDQASNPNNEKKPHISLNTIKTWIRKNDEKWVELRSSYPFTTYITDEYREQFTATEIFNELK